MTKRATAEAGIAILCERHPGTFSLYEQRPLKVGIRGDLEQALAGTMTPQEIGAALRHYCLNKSYLRSLLAGAWRIDLDGNPAGDVTTEQEADAQARLAKIERPKPKAPAAPPPVRRLGLSDLKTAARQRRNPTKAA